MNEKTSTHVKEGSGSLTGRINVRTQIRPTHDAITGALDLKDSLRRDPVVYPFGNRLWGDPKGAREIGLGAERLKNTGKNLAAHIPPFIHSQFMSVNEQIIDYKPPVYEAWLMKQIPQPRDYGDFVSWIKAAVAYEGTQRALAKKINLTPQAMTKYVMSKGIPSPKTIQKMADWGGINYRELRDLAEGKKVIAPSALKEHPNRTSTPLGAQIGRQWEQIQDERARRIIAEQIQLELERQNNKDEAIRKRRTS